LSNLFQRRRFFLNFYIWIVKYIIGGKLQDNICNNILVIRNILIKDISFHEIVFISCLRWVSKVSFKATVIDKVCVCGVKETIIINSNTTPSVSICQFKTLSKVKRLCFRFIIIINPFRIKFSIRNVILFPIRTCCSYFLNRNIMSNICPP
jgi:hypothetical protein